MTQRQALQDPPTQQRQRNEAAMRYGAAPGQRRRNEPESRDEDEVQSRSANESSRPPTHDEIARRAYEIYVKNGRQPNQCQQNWMEAERQLCCGTDSEASTEAMEEAGD